ncbi:MAG: hypothetical protein DCC55_26295 [Chloroflexi bacterium]|nr:MAG: hypothetical protein DCC55_26295 [Chloroflexota bacterium]
MTITRAPRCLRLTWLLLFAAAALTLLSLALVEEVWSQSPVSEPHDPGVAAPAAEASHIFHAALSGAKENPVVRTRASGYAVLALSDDLTQLSYRVLLSDLPNVQAAHIHRAADGGVQRPLMVIDDNLISGVITGITPAEVDALQNGEYYINVHTTAHPGGEIAGAIVDFAPPTGYSALLSGANERPTPVESDAIGVASFTRVSTATLEYRITISNSMAITLGHIHRGASDVAGPPVHTLYSSSTPLTESVPLTGLVELDAQGMVDLLTGYLYVNFHTAAHPAGEIRGQIGGAHLFSAELDGNQETPPVETLAYGRAVLALSADASTLAYRVTVEDLADINNQHIHRAPRGEPGGVEFPLPAFGDGNVISGTIAVDDLHVLRLIKGDYYVNVHTVTHGPGEIRGQIEPLAPPPRYSALLTGAAEVPPVETEGAGFARFKARPVINVIDYYLAVTDIDSLTQAHIHMAPAGSANPAPTHFLHGPGDGPLGADNPAAGALLFDAQDFVDLLTGYYYVNVHSSDHPGGEIRGQIGRAHAFVTHMDGGQEEPPHLMDAFGHGVFALNADASQFVYRIFADGLDGDISLAHIHTGKPGVNGPPDFTLFGGTGLFDSAHPISGTITFTEAHVLKLVSGAYYVNVHTASLNNAGVIRGQIEPLAAPTRLNALLNGANERPDPVDTAAAGVARLGWEQHSNMLHYHIAVSNTPSITLAHIHRAPAEGFGGVVHNLFDPATQEFDSDSPLIGNLRFNHNDIVDLLSGWFYINVHTEDHSGGEMRGQIGTLRTYQALLTGAKERPNPVTTTATGVGTLVLSGDASELSYRVAVTNITDILMAHIHIGGPEEAGPPRFTLWNNGPGLFDPTHPISGMETLDTADLLNLAGGNFYINVHTQQHPGGEIRGQVDPYHPFGRFQTLLTEGEEVSAAATEARGLAAFQLNEYPVITLQYAISVQDIPLVTMAHIHKGLPGENGPPIFTLTATEGALAPDSPLSGAVTLRPGQLLDLLTGYYYVNVHTTEKPAGHIRGQFYVDGSMVMLLLPLVEMN